MRQNRTSNKNRATYIYYDAKGNKLAEIKPGVDGVATADIAMLHMSDDDEFNAGRREAYHIPVHYSGFLDIDGDDMVDRNEYLADDTTNPETALIAAMTHVERDGMLKKIWDGLLPQQRDLIIKKLLNRSNVDIAAEEGVTEAAIRNRLKKIQEKFKNLR